MQGIEKILATGEKLFYKSLTIKETAPATAKDALVSQKDMTAQQSAVVSACNPFINLLSIEKLQALSQLLNNTGGPVAMGVNSHSQLANGAANGFGVLAGNGGICMPANNGNYMMNMHSGSMIGNGSSGPHGGMSLGMGGSLHKNGAGVGKS